MADTKISGLTEDTAPHGTNDYVATVDASASASKKVRLKNLGVIRLTAGCQNASPADGTTYYFGNDLTTLSTTDGLRRIYIQRAGIITAAFVNITATGAGSAENFNLYIRLNSTTDTLVSAVAANSSILAYSITALSIAVAVGDYIEGKIVTPTWVTNPPARRC